MQVDASLVGQFQNFRRDLPGVGNHDNHLRGRVLKPRQYSRIRQLLGLQHGDSMRLRQDLDRWGKTRFPLPFGLSGWVKTPLSSTEALSCSFNKVGQANSGVPKKTIGIIVLFTDRRSGYQTLSSPGTSMVSMPKISFLHFM